MPAAPAMVAAGTAVLMVAVAAFWMITWLIGTNGYGTTDGGIILGGNALLAVAGIVFATWLARTLSVHWLRLGWPGWGAGALAIVVGVTATVLAMGVGSLLLIVAVEIWR